MTVEPAEVPVLQAEPFESLGTRIWENIKGGNLGSAPVLISQRNLDSPDIAQLIGRTLRESRVAALRGQGVFARGTTIGLHRMSGWVDGAL